ncbi:MAG: hypothetical protein IJ729_03070 [Alloprevotella sp.]|nr:hypothetical protein [Alloprevotella sp.]
MAKYLPKAVCGILVSVTLLLTGCMSDDYEDETTGNCVITNITLGTLNQIVHTKTSSGADSTYIATVTGSLYPMSIDHVARQVFNLDSLPVGTDASKVVFSNFSSSSSASIRSLMTGLDSIFSAKDSTDFSVPREITVYAKDGVSKRTYTVEVRVHNEDGEATTWNRLGISTALQDAQPKRAIETDGRLYVFAVTSDGSPALFSTDTSAPADLEKTPITPETINPESVVYGEGTFYALAEGTLMRSTDGKVWNEAGATLPDGHTSLKALVLSGTQRLVGIADDQIISSTDAGDTWQEDTCDTQEGLPTVAITGLCTSPRPGINYETLVLVGNYNGVPTVWKQDIDPTGTDTYPWMKLMPAKGNACPSLESYTLAAYDSGILLTGRSAENTLADFYMSYDSGNTWLTGAVSAPEAAGTEFAVTTDDEGHIFLFCGSTGEVWRGRLNRLGWKSIQHNFIK